MDRGDGPADSADLEPELAEAYSGSRVDAELIRSVLEGSGVECALWGTGSTYLPETGAKLNRVRVMVRPSDLDRAHEVIDAAGVGDLDLRAEDDWEPPDTVIGESDTAIGEPAAADWEDDPDDELVGGPWYSRPWGQVVMGLIALLVVVA